MEQNAKRVNAEVKMNIWIWGTGQIAQQVYENGLKEISGFIETKKTKEMFFNKPVVSAEEIPTDADWIVVATRYTDEIFDYCMSLQLDIKRIVFLCAGKKNRYVEISPNLRETLGEINFTNYQAEYNMTAGTFFERDAEVYRKLNQRKNFEIRQEYLWPVIGEKYAPNGAMDNYFWQDLWAAKKIIKSGVREHYDIGSRVDGFIAHLLAADIQVNVIDIRPFPAQVENLHTVVDNATMLTQFEDNSIMSMSALCSLEHFGLGRYGDPVDPEACFQCFAQIQKKMKKGGNLFISLPVGMERVEFNAHRVFYAETIKACFAQMKLAEFSCAAEGKIEYHVDIHKYDTDGHNGEHRYGLFHFVK